MCRVVVIALLAGTAHAEPKTAAEWLAAGRMYEGKGDHIDSVRAFTEALKLTPGDATLLTELGLARYGAKDYTNAETATLDAIAASPAPTYHNDPAGFVRGAAYYNLGLIYIALDRKSEAAMVFGESLKARPSRTVRERLQQLDATLGALRDPLAPVVMPGPFPSVKDACRDALKRRSQDPDLHWGDHFTCTDPTPYKIDSAKLGKAIEEVVAFQMDDRSELDFAARVRGGWYFAVLPGKQERAVHCGGTTFGLPSATVVGARLQIDYTSAADGCSHDGNGHSRTWGWAERGVLVIGVGPSGAPSLMPPIPTKVREWDQYDADPKESLAEIDVKLAWPREGVLDVSGTVAHPAYAKSKRPLGPDDVDPEELLGHHIISFP